MTENEQQSDIGSQIIKSVYKASLQALFSIGVKSPDNVEKFTASFTRALDREFLKIGLLPQVGGTPRTEPYPTAEAGSPEVGNLLTHEELTHANMVLPEDTVQVRSTYPPLEEALELNPDSGFATMEISVVKSLDDSLDKLQLMNIIVVRLKKQGINTVGELMTRMQNAPLTTIVGIKEKSATQILEALKLWNSS